MKIRILKYKQKKTLTGLGWILILSILLIVFIVFLKTIHPFLAETDPVRGEVLVVEGWMPDYAFEKAAEEFELNNYKFIISVGGKLPKGFYLSEYKTSGNMGAAILSELDIDNNRIRIVNVPSVELNRTFSCAKAFRASLKNSGLNIKSFDIVSLGTHARRSRILYEKAFDNEMNIGIISVTNKNYDPENWWLCSDGFREVTGDIIAYLYVKILFRPR